MFYNVNISTMWYPCKPNSQCLLVNENLRKHASFSASESSVSIFSQRYHLNLWLLAPAWFPGWMTWKHSFSSQCFKAEHRRFSQWTQAFPRGCFWGLETISRCYFTLSTVGPFTLHTHLHLLSPPLSPPSKYTFSLLICIFWVVVVEADQSCCPPIPEKSIRRRRGWWQACQKKSMWTCVPPWGAVQLSLSVFTGTTLAVSVLPWFQWHCLGNTDNSFLLSR